MRLPFTLTAAAAALYPTLLGAVCGNVNAVDRCAALPRGRQVNRPCS